MRASRSRGARIGLAIPPAANENPIMQADSRFAPPPPEVRLIMTLASQNPELARLVFAHKPVLFHGSAADPAIILAHGLVPQGGEGADAWAAAYATPHTSEPDALTHMRNEARGFVYATPFVQLARFYASLAARIRGDTRPVVYRISIPATARQQWQDDPRDPGESLRHHGPVPAQWLAVAPEDKPHA